MSNAPINATPQAKTPRFLGRKMYLIGAVAAGVITTILLVVLLQNITATTTYYVLNTSLPARTQVTEADLTPIVTSEGGAPENAYGIGEVATGEVYTKIALNAGDIITFSNSGVLSPLSEGLPDDYVVASFVTSPNFAAGGNITRGDYVDMFYITTSEENVGIKLLLQKVLILDATANLEESTAPEETEAGAEGTISGSATEAYRSGVPSLYTVGVSQEDAAKIGLAAQSTIYLALSSQDTVENGAEEKFLQFLQNELADTLANDAGEGTDNAFPDDETATENDNTEANTEPDTDTETESPAPAPEPEEPTTEDEGGVVTTP